MSKDILTVEEQIIKLNRENKIMIIFGICFNLFLAAILIIVGVFAWQPALYFLLSIPLSLLGGMLAIKANKTTIAELKKQKEGI